MTAGPGTSSSPRAMALVRVLTHVLVATLLAVAGIAAAFPAPHWAELATVTAFAVVYASGVVWTRRDPDRFTWWGAALSGVWLLLVAQTPLGVWLAFPLFFLALAVLPVRAGLPVVGALTAVAVTGFAWHRGGWELGAVLGPVLGAVVAAVVVLGIRVATEDNQRRGRLAERERMSREIHDTIAQGLGSIHLLLSAAEEHLAPRPQTARDLVRQAREVAAVNLEEARRLVRAQGPAGLVDRGLVEALRRLPDPDAGPPVRVTVAGTPRRLTPAQDAALLRIAQEALANARRHAGAGVIDVTLTFHDDAVGLDVADDGNGLVDAAAGHGIRGMRARAAELDGTLVVESRPGAGTAVAASLPTEHG